MFILMFTVAILWGCTNPFLRHYSEGISTRPQMGFVEDIRFLLSRRGYLAALGVNLLGSVAFYLSMRDNAVGVVVPVANALTFVVTGVVGMWLFGERISVRTLVGLLLIVIGVGVTLL
jgi:multidrug transporter EmrE-like cation transporter